MDFSLSSFLGHLDKEQTAESARNDDQKVISNDVSILLKYIKIKENINNY